MYTGTTLSKKRLTFRGKGDSILAFRTICKLQHAIIVSPEHSTDDEDNRARLRWLKPATPA